MRPIDPRQREEAEREFERFLARRAEAGWQPTAQPKPRRTDAEKERERRSAFRLGVAVFAIGGLIQLAMCAPPAAAQVPEDKLDQAVRCGFYLATLPNADADLAAEAVMSGLSERQMIVVATRIKETGEQLKSLEGDDLARAYREIQGTWRPNCVAIGVLGSGK